IVGGSLLSHDHYQCGAYTFGLNKAKTLKTFTYNDISIDILNWPASCLKIKAINKSEILTFINDLYLYWSKYSNEQLDIISNSNGIRHNTVTPIITKQKNVYECYLVLRNNRCNEQYPDGIFHVHPDKHHIKKENIGLIEIMGLAILPGRLLKEINQLIDCISNKEELSANLIKHQSLYQKFYKNNNSREELKDLIYQEIGSIFVGVLRDCAVFKDYQDLITFVEEFIYEQTN
ncbi:MAG: UDP-glucose--hexose-1-phosphate uridylyltransferase, partial [Bacilli bacterium]